MTPPTITAIQLATAAQFKIPAFKIQAHQRTREYARPRQVAMYLAYTLTGCSLTYVGKRFAKRDHSTVLYAVRLITRMRKNNEYYPEGEQYLGDAIEAIIAKLTAVALSRSADRQSPAPYHGRDRSCPLASPD
jgi:chromosomal replication initiator protein